jgi:hypothetical protein
MTTTQKNISILTISLVLATFIGLSWAAGAGDKINLMATPKHPDASGTALINNDGINIQAQGLKPDSVYTVWFVNMKPKKHEAGAGAPPYMFKTDASGAGTYSAPLGESPFGKWKMLMIVLHPNGDPKDMQSMVGALSAKL